MKNVNDSFPDRDKNTIFSFEFRNSETKIAEYAFFVHKSDGKSIEGWVEQFKNIFLSSTIKKSLIYKVNNLDIYSYKYDLPVDLTDTGGRFPSPSPYENSSEYLFFSDGKQKIYGLQIFTAKPENETLANQILSTFQFTK